MRGTPDTLWRFLKEPQMQNTLEEEYHDFIQIQGLKGQIDVQKVCAELRINEEELFEFINERVSKLEEEGFTSQNVGEYLGTSFLFAYWLRGVRSPGESRGPS